MAKAYEGVMKMESSRSSHRQSKKAVKKCCEVCGKTTTLHVHHADENPLNNSPSNLMTLCAQCHREAHSPNFSAPKERITCKHCDKPAMKKGLCWTHNTRYQKYGNPLMTKKKIGSEFILITEDGS
ncbi:MAG: HNH endonuclease [Methylomicrobium sp.]|nr:HNH endonuclease [Methylomicrobium sp.]